MVFVCLLVYLFLLLLNVSVGLFFVRLFDITISQLFSRMTLKFGDNAGMYYPLFDLIQCVCGGGGFACENVSDL